MSEPMPTKAQYEYMAKADEVEQHAMTRWGSSIFWLFWAMGRTSTGQACFRRGWIRERVLTACNANIIGSSTTNGPTGRLVSTGLYQLTASGRAALARYREEVGNE